MAVLLSASLFFLGCPTEEEETTDPNPDEGRTAVSDLALAAFFDAPATGGTPETALKAAATQYTGTIAWTPTVSGTFAGKTVYTAAVTLAAANDRTFSAVAGKAAGSSTFTYTGATSVANTAGTTTGITVTVVFPETDPTPEQAAADLKEAITGATVSGTTVTLGASYEVTGTAQSPTVVPAGVTLAVPATFTLTVPDTKGLSVAGTLRATLINGAFHRDSKTETVPGTNVFSEGRQPSGFLPETDGGGA
jgi:hypothetical protein